MKNTALKFWLIFILLSITWGSSFILMKKAMLCFTPYQVAALRIVITGVILLPFAILNFKILTKKNTLYFAAVGLLGSTIPAFCFTTAQQHISSALAGILNALTPLFVLLIALIIFKQKPKKINVIGIIISLLGAITIVLVGNKSLIGNNNIYAWLIVIACLCYGINMNNLKMNLSQYSSVSILSIGFALMLPIALPILFNSDFVYRLQNNDCAVNAMICVSILGIAGTAIAGMLNNYMVKHTGVLFASSVTYAMPIVALIWGVIDNEVINTLQIFCMVIILAGIYLVNKK